MVKPIVNRYLSFAEREEIALLSVQGLRVREIAERIGRSPSTISRGLTRNAATRSRYREYCASSAQWKVDRLVKLPKPAKLATNERLRQ
jgi:IS30 family transposase